MPDLPLTAPPAGPAARTTVTAALPYANGPVHIGHVAGVYLPADIYVRYLRMQGRPVLFVCGSDEHGVPITMRATREGLTPQQVVDKYHVQIREAFEGLSVSFDVYGRTSSPTHHEMARGFFDKLYGQGYLRALESEQYYDPEAGRFLADRYIQGTCPRCGNPSAYGDQCERCGATLSPDELISPRSTQTQAALVKRPTRHYYLPLDDEQAFLTSWLTGPDTAHWKPNVLGQCRSWLEGGLTPRAVTRDLDWGVPVPTHVPDHEGKVLYVWFDAPIGYISATREWAEARPGERHWQDWWATPEANQTGGAPPRLIHFIGKDNIVFHCLIFPAMLRAHGGYVLPAEVPANEFLNLEGEKISTSRNWAVWLHEYLEDLPGKADVLRYALCATLPESKDNDFTWRELQARCNNELVAVLGNLVNRVLTLTERYFEGRVPAVEFGTGDEAVQAREQAIAEAIGRAPGAVSAALERFALREALGEVMALARAGNGFMQEAAPWQTIKTDPALTGRTLYLGLQLLGTLSILIEPFLPESAGRLRGMLGFAPGSLSDARDPHWVRLPDEGPAPARPKVPAEALTWAHAGAIDLVRPGQALGPVSLLYEKIEDALIEGQLEKLRQMARPAGATATEPTHTHSHSSSTPTSMSTTDATPAPESATTESQAAPAAPVYATIDDFAKIELKVGRVMAVKPVPKADKLLELSVDLGEATGPRTILSGIAQHFTPEQVEGRQVVVVANLAPRKMRGMESQGMILLAEDASGKLTFVGPDGDVPPGATVR